MVAETSEIPSTENVAPNDWTPVPSSATVSFSPAGSSDASTVSPAADRERFVTSASPVLMTLISELETGTTTSAEAPLWPSYDSSSETSASMNPAYEACAPLSCARFIHVLEYENSSHISARLMPRSWASDPRKLEPKSPVVRLCAVVGSSPLLYQLP